MSIKNQILVLQWAQLVSTLNKLEIKSLQGAQ